MAVRMCKVLTLPQGVVCCEFIGGAPRTREAHASVAPYLRKCGNLPISEILAIT